MSFAENLKKLRAENHLSQEDLAELLDVSRQAVSKWESCQAYPELEKLLLLSRKLNVSLDNLMDTGFEKAQDKIISSPVKSIVITSPNENVISNCYKVISSGKMRGGKSSPQYALFGVSYGASSFWGEATTFLAWYADKDSLTKEIEEIQSALLKGEAAYTLKYSAKTERKWAQLKVKEK